MLDAHEVQLFLEVEGDGCGLALEHGRGVGLSSMRERAEELGGGMVSARHTRTGLFAMGRYFWRE